MTKTELFKKTDRVAKVSIQTRVSADIKDEFEEIAKELNESVSSTNERAIRLFINEYRKTRKAK